MGITLNFRAPPQTRHTSCSQFSGGKFLGTSDRNLSVKAFLLRGTYAVLGHKGVGRGF